ncbi:laccase [Nasonia vitripennis]|uniref:Uncharacterized protein n=1 Tax=Nasonia vitripennis TaxID=7425 RepID=A0A7M7QD70_NASVI|nr:laccase [Nasonia vitripennis]
MPHRAMINLRLFVIPLIVCAARLCTADAVSTPAEESKYDDPDKIGLLPQSYGMGLPDDEVDWSRRPCRSDREPLTCRYGLTVERYISMSKACYDCPRNLTDCSRPHCMPGDGSEKMVIVANRKLPGLSIEACKGDRLLVDVTNKLPTETTTIYWNGLHQRGTPFMDGVPYLTQCPIMPGEVFRYDFIADCPGSFIWHSHSGEYREYYDSLIHIQSHADQRVDAQDGIRSLYYALLERPGYIAERDFGQWIGMGRLSHLEAVNMPLEVFEVQENFSKGKRYRFRLLNLGSQNCPIHVSIDDHPMLAISADGADIKSVEVDSIHIMPGERYDFVLSADQPVDNYWIRLKGDIMCSLLETPQLASLRYRSSIFYHHRYAKNLDNFDYHRENLYGYWKVRESKRSTSLQLNHISFKMPNFPPLTQPELIKPKQLCNYSTIIAIEKCKTEHCACTQTFQARLNSVVELVLIDPGAAKLNHPIHLHGYYYRVVAMEKVGDKLSIEEVKKMDQEGKIHRRLEAEPWKDSVIVPTGGYTIVRFYANNPEKNKFIEICILIIHFTVTGEDKKQSTKKCIYKRAIVLGYCCLHCHYDQHANDGMALLVKVGKHEDFPNVPKNFPRCGAH